MGGPQVEKAVTRGLFFEVRYGPVIEEAPGQRRQQFMSMLMNTFDVLRGKHAMVTSGARAVEPLRGAHDVVNLAIVLGLKEVSIFSTKLVYHDRLSRERVCCYPWVME